MTKQRETLMFTSHLALALVIVIPLMFIVHQEVSLVKRCHIMQNPVVLQPSADNGLGHQDTLQQPAPQRITPMPSNMLADALRPDTQSCESKTEVFEPTKNF
ncbi:hypothetical protein P692DRAFT_20820480 [Suillus brevipes Sb2]|nr:hypothetical protein P692DRAFT_20820480 [Suillus brevipes Sb2]